MPRALPVLVLVGLVLLVGCLGVGVAPPETASPSTAPATTPTASAATPTPLPDAAVSFPDGPKDPPDRPATLTAATVREYVRTHEYRAVYNRLWYGPGTDVSLNCTVHSVAPVRVGYEAVVSCTGYSNTRAADANATGTAAPVHADHFTRYREYLVGEGSTVRRRATATERATTAEPTGGRTATE